LLFPSAFCGGLLCDLFAPLSCHARRPRLAAHAPQRHGGGVLLAVLGGDGFDLADGDLGGVAAGVGAVLFAFWTSGIILALPHRQV
jgi:hypothetical protein